MSIIYTIPQSHCRIVERLGKFARVQREGLCFRLPFIEEFKTIDAWGPVANKNGLDIELAEQQTDTPTRLCHTKDNVAVNANASVYWRIIDARRAVYEIEALPRAVGDVALNALRSHVGQMNLDEVLAERQALNDRIAAELSETAQKWGIQFTRVEIQELQTSDETAKSMLQQADADRRRRAAMAEAEGRASAQVTVAQSEAQASLIIAEGHARALAATAAAEADYLARLSAAVSKEDAARLLMATKALRALEQITANPAHKVFLPGDFKGLVQAGGQGDAG